MTTSASPYLQRLRSQAKLLVPAAAQCRLVVGGRTSHWDPGAGKAIRGGGGGGVGPLGPYLLRSVGLQHLLSPRFLHRLLLRLDVTWV